MGIIKPDGVNRNLIGKILERAEEGGLKIVALRMQKLEKHEAENFYSVHKGKPFFNSLVSYMTSGAVVVFAMEGDNAISRWREIMGATNPENAANGTIRRDFAIDVEKNTVHGSDAPETAGFELACFFS